MAATSSGVISGSDLPAKMIDCQPCRAPYLPSWHLLPTGPKTHAPFSASAMCVSVNCMGRFPLVEASLAFENDAFRVAQNRVFRRQSHGFNQLKTGNAAEPAPLTAILMSLMSRPVRCNALISPAAQMMAVPCWSMENRNIHQFRNCCSMIKQSGARMSSRLLPPNDGPSLTASMKALNLQVDFQINRVDIGKAFEQTAHHRFGGQSPTFPSPNGVR